MGQVLTPGLCLTSSCLAGESGCICASRAMMLVGKERYKIHASLRMAHAIQLVLTEQRSVGKNMLRNLVKGIAYLHEP